jgi:hypothetical protein
MGQQRDAIVARYSDLGGGLSALGDTRSEQLWAEFARRYARREMEPLLELFADDYVLIDHRVIGWEPIRGHDGVAAVISGGVGFD